VLAFLVVLLILSLMFGGFRKGKVHSSAGIPRSVSANSQVMETGR
jgi:hypothetical protein